MEKLESKIKRSFCIGKRAFMLKYYLLCQHYAQFLILPIMLMIMPAYLMQAYLSEIPNDDHCILVAKDHFTKLMIYQICTYNLFSWSYRGYVTMYLHCMFIILMLYVVYAIFMFTKSTPTNVDLYFFMCS